MQNILNLKLTISNLKPLLLSPKHLILSTKQLPQVLSKVVLIIKVWTQNTSKMFKTEPFSDKMVRIQNVLHVPTEHPAPKP